MPAVDDFKSFNRFDQLVLAGGVLAFILSFFHVFVVTASGLGASALGGNLGHATAWHNWGFLAMLLVLAATAVAAVRLFAAASMPTMPVGVNLLTLVLSGLGLLFMIIAWFHNSKSASGVGYKVSAHLGIAGYLLLLAILAQTVAAFLLFKSSGEAMPDFKAMQANKAAGAGTPPPPVYGNTGATPPAATYPPATPAGDYTLDDSTPPPPSA